MRFYASILLRFYVLFGFSCGILRGQLLNSSTTPPTSTTNLPRVYTDFPDEITVPCRVPSFIKILPVHFRRQLRKIWSGVPSPNSDCTQQLIETHQLIDTLPVSLKLKMAEFGEEKDRFRANFFSELLPEEKAEFGEILKNISLNATEKAQLLKNWAASRLSIAAMENLEEYLHAFIERDRKFQEKVANLSQEAKDAYARIQNIRKEKQSIFARLSEKAKKELVNLFKSVCTTSSKPNMDFKSVHARNVEEDEQPLSPMDAAILSNEPFHADPLEKELSCFVFRAPLRHLLRQKFESLTRSHNIIMQPTPVSAISLSTMDPATHLFQLLLQRVPYFKPYTADRSVQKVETPPKTL